MYRDNHVLGHVEGRGQKLVGLYEPVTNCGA
jgi:hypothetical protein